MPHNHAQSVHVDVDEDDEDEDEDDVNAAFPNGFESLEGWSTKRGKTDEAGNDLLIMVDQSGIHHMGVKWCCCANFQPVNMQLFAMGLYPATIQKPRTCFTFAVLDDFRLTNLECKTAALNFYSLLRRRTNNACPDSVPVSLGKCLECAGD